MFTWKKLGKHDIKAVLFLGGAISRSGDPQKSSRHAMQGAHAKHHKLQLWFFSVQLLSLNCVAGDYKGGKSCCPVFQFFVSSRVITELLD